MTYCINSECPFRDCEKHLSKSRSKGKVYVANFDGICKRYITWMLKECEECMKDAPHGYCCLCVSENEIERFFEEARGIGEQE